ncbi:MAG TPA: glycosyltransferase family 1 protein [Chthoniobacteraceae bacterium]|nr:glycosyltransferase family 1 protein [Chthoniobacteraceae bacterium]
MNESLHIGLIVQGGAGWMGGSEYIKNLAHALAAVGREQPDRFRLSLITGHPLDHRVRREIGIEKLIELPSRRRGTLARLLRAGNRAFAAAVREARIDFLYPLTYDNEHNIGVSLPLAASLKKTRWAGWIPDFQHRQLPDLFSESEIAKRDRGIDALARNARTIVFSSEASAADYKRFCPNANARAEVLRFCTAPIPEWLAGDPHAEQAGYHLPDRFFLISNQLWKHKNHLLVLDALGILAGRGIRPHIVCTGQPADFRDKNYLNVVLQRIHERGLGAQVALLGLVPRAAQIQLMRRCVAVIQPSLCEGWSTVVEDARVLGKTVVLSDLDVHREQNPPGAHFFDRASAEHLATVLTEVWAAAEPGPDHAREADAADAAAQAQLAFGRRFLEIAEAA